MVAGNIKLLSKSFCEATAAGDPLANLALCPVLRVYPILLLEKTQKQIGNFIEDVYNQDHLYLSLVYLFTPAGFEAGWPAVAAVMVPPISPSVAANLYAHHIFFRSEHKPMPFPN